jgi:ABC-type microcin C transport system permease subunit YejE
MLRQSQELPWLRLALILGLVALCTLLSTLVFRTHAIRKHFNLDKG